MTVRILVSPPSWVAVVSATTLRTVRSTCVALILSLLLTAADTAGEALVVHLPSAPIENANRLAEAMRAFGNYLAQNLPDTEIEVRMFRRLEDAESYLETNGPEVIALLADASLLLDRQAVAGFAPTFRFVRDGRETYRRALVVKSDRQDLRSLADLRGRTLAVVETSGRSMTSFLELVVFEGELEPRAWFGELELVADDYSATAAVLYGQTDAALVSLDNPLLQSHLGKELQVVYTSAELSLPVLAVREEALGKAQREALDGALRRLGGGEAGLADLKLDGLRAIRAGTGRFERDALLSLPRRGRKRMEIALPTSRLLEPSPTIAGSPEALGFSLVVEVPEIPPAAELVGSAP